MANNMSITAIQPQRSHGERLLGSSVLIVVYIAEKGSSRIKKLSAKNFKMGSQHIYRMLQLTHMNQQANQLWRAVIAGPVGVIEIRDLVWIVDRADILEIYYWESWAVLQGAYHCCWSIPGKVTLLPA
jgi:hypothetical protein